jgi:hypothetical protein
LFFLLGGRLSARRRGQRPFVSALLLLAASSAAAQEQHGAVVGAVFDPARATAGGADVELRSAGGLAARTATDGSGRFRFPSLPPGRYTATATRSGFTPARPVTLTLLLGQTLEIELQLAMPGVAEAVEVAARAPVIDMRQSGVAMSIRDELIDSLPRGRDFSNLVTQAGGINAERKLAGLSIDGASGAENRYVIDGIDTTDPWSGKQGKLLPPELVEEVQVKYGGYGAEHGGATGGVVNTVTRSGTNRWHGEVGAVYGSDALGVALETLGENANFTDGRPTLRISPTNNTAAEYVVYPKDGYVSWQPTFTVGGPLVRDRLWLFAGYMPQITRQERTVTFLANRETGTFSRTQRQHFATGSLLARLGEETRLRLAVNLSPLSSAGLLPGAGGAGNPAIDFGALGYERPDTALSVALDHAASRSLHLSARAGLYRSDYRDVGVPNVPLVAFATTNIGMAGVPAELQRSRSFRTVPSNTATTRDLQNRLSVHADATWYAALAGDHALKAGVQLDHTHNDVLGGYLQPVVSLRWGLPFATSDGRLVRGTYGTYVVSQAGEAGNVTADNLALFLQDSWTLGRRLTLNVGLRAEHETVPSYAADPRIPRTAIDFGFGEKLAPRLGFALDPNGDGRWKVHGSWGRYYDVTKSLMPRGSLGGLFLTDHAFTLDDPDWTRIPPPGCPPACPGRLIEAYRIDPPLNDPAENRIDPALRPMRQQEWVLGVERALTPTIRLSARYIHKKLDTAVEDVGVVLPGSGEEYYLANPGFGVAQTTLPLQCGGWPCPDQPPARRDYRAFVVDLRRTMSAGYGFHVAYQLGELRGNYSGLADSDSDSGLAAPNFLRTFDSLIMSFDETGRPAIGPLGTDRPHQLKVDGIARPPFGTTFGARWSWASGIPINQRVMMQSGAFPVHHLGRASGGRTPAVSQLDLSAQHEVGLGGRRRLQFTANALNVLGQQTATSVFSFANQSSIAITDADFFRGFDADKLMDAQRTLRDPRFGLAHRFQEPRSVWLAVKLLF